MLWPVLALAVALLVPLVTGGSYARLLEKPWRWGLFLAGGLGIQLALDFLPLPQSRWPDVGFGLLVGSYVLLLAFCARNWLVRGMSVVFVGIALNTIAITANQGMPVKVPPDWQADGRIAATVKHHPREASDSLLVLTDIILLRSPFNTVLSFGDLILAVGLCDVTFHASRSTRRRRRAPDAPHPTVAAAPPPSAPPIDLTTPPVVDVRRPAPKPTPTPRPVDVPGSSPAPFADDDERVDRLVRVSASEQDDRRILAAARRGQAATRGGSSSAGRASGDPRGDMEQIDLTEVEREICRLPDVSLVRIVADEHGSPIEVHVVAHEGKHPKQIVRDVQSVALASFGLEFDRRIVSVVQLGAHSSNGSGHDMPRPAIAGITAESTGLRSHVRVTLARADEQAVGHAEGSVATTARHRLVAVATLDALRQLEPTALAIDVDHATVTRVGSHDVAVVTIVFISPPAEHVVAGSAIVHAQQESDAVARAVLDATNRRLAWDLARRLEVAAIRSQ